MLSRDKRMEDGHKANASSVIKVNNLTAHYMIDKSTSVHAVDNVSFLIREGDIIGIAGESGSGKSTLLKVLTAQVAFPLRIVKGEVIYNIDGKSVNLLSLREKVVREMRWKLFSVVPQGSMNSLNPVSKIKDIFTETIRAHQKVKNPNKEKELMENVLEKTNLSKNFLNFYPSQLSGGMRQRIVIALATILNPSIIFCDEPTTGLDLVSQKAVMRLLRDLCDNYGNTLVVISHDMSFHAQLVEKIIVMYGGQIVEIGKTKDIFAKPYHPYTKFLIDSLPVIGEKKRRKGIKGAPFSLLNASNIGCRFRSRCPYAAPACEKEEMTLVEVEPEHMVACNFFNPESDNFGSEKAPHFFLKRK